MQRRCARCGVGFEARRSDAKFCSDKCRKQVARAEEEGGEKPSDLEVQVRARLTEAGMTDSILGQQAIELARRMCSPVETASAAAAVSRELREVMVAVEQARPPEVDPVEQLRQRRDLKVVSG